MLHDTLHGKRQGEEDR